MSGRRCNDYVCRYWDGYEAVGIRALKSKDDLHPEYLLQPRGLGTRSLDLFRALLLPIERAESCTEILVHGVSVARRLVGSKNIERVRRRGRCGEKSE